MLDAAVEARIRAAMNHEEGDRVPIWDYLDNRATVEHFAEPGDDLDTSMRKVYHGLGIDLCRGYGESFAVEDDEPAEGRGAGETEGESRTRVTGRSRWVTRYAIRSLEQLRGWTAASIDRETRRQEVLRSFHRLRESLEPYTMFVPGCGCGFHAAYGEMGLELFSYAIYEAPEKIEELMWYHNEAGMVAVEAAADEQLCPLFFIGDDIAYKGALMFSPAYLRRTFIKLLGRMCERLNNAGIKVIYHSDGYVMEILDDMIEAGIAGLNPIEPLAGMDIGLLKRRYGRNLILVGNVDCSQVLPLGTVDEVVEATKACIRAASPGGGHFIGSSSEITPSTPLENVLAFYRTARECGRYPIRC